jgi:hypothetical protein
MHFRPVHFLPVATVFLLASPDAPAASFQGSYTLRIESLNRSPLKVRITTANIAPEGRRVPQRDTVLAPPTSLPIPDLVGRVHVVVIGFASVRVTLTNSSVPADSLVSMGRDITLARKANGRFERIWTAQPLVP